jgi:hypothetical protein
MTNVEGMANDQMTNGLDVVLSSFGFRVCFGHSSFVLRHWFTDC